MLNCLNDNFYLIKIQNFKISVRLKHSRDVRGIFHNVQQCSQGFVVVIGN